MTAHDEMTHVPPLPARAEIPPDRPSEVRLARLRGFRQPTFTELEEMSFLEEHVRRYHRDLKQDEPGPRTEKST